MTTSLTPEHARGPAIEAYTYGFTTVENYKAMFVMAVWRDSPQYSGFNKYLHGRVLFDSSYDAAVNANNDTLHSTAFADLRAEPLVITVPPTGDRYFVIQIVDTGTDNFAYIRTHNLQTNHPVPGMATECLSILTVRQPATHPEGGEMFRTLLDVFWVMLWFYLFFIWIWLLISIFSDIFRRDTSGLLKAIWVLVLIAFPLLGALIYLIANGGDMQVRAASQVAATESAQKDYIRSVAGSSTADELTKLSQLRDSGVLTADEFAAQKAKLLA